MHAYYFFKLCQKIKINDKEEWSKRKNRGEFSLIRSNDERSTGQDLHHYFKCFSQITSFG